MNQQLARISRRLSFDRATYSLSETAGPRGRERPAGQLGDAGVAAVGTCDGLPILTTIKPLGSSKSLASGSPTLMCVTSKFSVPKRGSSLLLSRLTPNSGEYQNSRFVIIGRLFPMALLSITMVSRWPVTSNPSIDCLPKSSIVEAGDPLPG